MFAQLLKAHVRFADISVVLFEISLKILEISADSMYDIINCGEGGF